MHLKYLLILLCIYYSKSAQLPTNYEYYTSGGIKSGLIAEGKYFTLNGKEIRLLSGSLHYFRVPQQYWRDRLLKMKAAGLNAVEFISIWNLHEEIPGHFDFETGMLNLTDFFVAIKEADMFAIFRPGPYICGEWENGGLPAWLFRDPNMKFRTYYGPYLNAVENYFNKLFAFIKEFQFTTNGGPIIAVQLENEFGYFGNTSKSISDYEYLEFLKNNAIKNGVKELLFTDDGSDGAADGYGSLPGLFRSVNLGDKPIERLTLVASKQKRPLFTSEYWSGWFTHWGDSHMIRQNITTYEANCVDIMFKMNSSISIYMFNGGTNFGFMNGGSSFDKNGHYYAVVTSYDYDAPLTEAGDYTDKYWKTKELIERLHNERPQLPKVRTPVPPNESPKANYGVINVTHYLNLNDILDKIKPISSEYPKHMEEINIGINYGQNWGFILYRTPIPKIKTLTIKGGVSDRAVILIDNNFVDIVEVVNRDSNINITNQHFLEIENKHNLDILVENMGRTNFGHENDNQRKGLNGLVLTDENVQKDWQIFPLEFKVKFIEGLKTDKWRPFANKKLPALYRAVLQINDKPMDTFLKLENWTKTVAFVNGFNVGRLWNIGPTKTLYIPGSVLKTGLNEIYLFELHSAGNTIEFLNKPDLG